MKLGPDLFNQAPSRLLWDVFRQAVVDVQRLSIHKYLPLSIARYSFIQLSELEQCTVDDLAQDLTGSEPGFS